MQQCNGISSSLYTPKLSFGAEQRSLRSEGATVNMILSKLRFAAGVLSSKGKLPGPAIFDFYPAMA